MKRILALMALTGFMVAPAVASAKEPNESRGRLGERVSLALYGSAPTVFSGLAGAAAGSALGGATAGVTGTVVGTFFGGFSGLAAKTAPAIAWRVSGLRGRIATRREERRYANAREKLDRTTREGAYGLTPSATKAPPASRGFSGRFGR